MTKTIVARRMLDSAVQAALVKADDAVQTSAAGQEMSGSVGHIPHDYGKLSDGDIQLSLSNGHYGLIERDNSSNSILLPSGPFDTWYGMVLDIIGTSDDGSPSWDGADSVDGDDLPRNGEWAKAYIECSPVGITVLVKLIPL